MSHETLLAFAKKKSKPYNLALKITPASTRTLPIIATGITTLKYGFSPTNITSTATISGGSFSFVIPAGTTNVYFIIPTPTTQLNSSLLFSTNATSDLITEVTHWDGYPLNRLAFNALKTLEKVPSTLWSACRDMTQMFNNCPVFNQVLNWNTANVTTMASMFYGCAKFNQPVNFNTANVTNMSNMFAFCPLFNQPVNFDTSKVTLMDNMFYDNLAFNQPVNFDTSKVTLLSGMFSGCSKFNQPVTFNIASATSLWLMFRGCSIFNQPVNLTNVTKVTSLNSMFQNCTVFNQDMSTTIFKSSATRTGYDTGASAWITANKPKFTG